METNNAHQGPYYTFWTQHPVIKRYSSMPLSDIIPIVFVLYAAFKDATVRFDGDGHLLGYDENVGEKDRMLKRLYDMTLSQLIDGKCREAEELAQTLPLYNDDQFKNEFPLHMEYFIRNRLGCRNSPFHPDEMENRIREILESHNASSIYEYSSGLGMVARSYDGWERYDTYDSSRIHLLYADLLNELTGKRTVFHTSRDYISMPQAMRYYDTIIASFLSPIKWAGKKARIDSLNSFFNALVSMDTWATAVVLVDYGFCVDSRYESARSILCERGILEEVNYSYTTFYDDMIFHSGIIVLNSRKVPTDPVVFINNEGRKTSKAGLDQLHKIHFALEPRFYHQDNASYLNNLWSEGADTVVMLGDLIKGCSKRELFTASDTEKEYLEIGLQENDFGNSIYTSIKPRIPHQVDYRTHNQAHGPALSILFSKRIEFPRVCWVDREMDYAYPFGSLTLIPSNDVDISYLISLLYLNKGVRHTLVGLNRIIFDTDYGSSLPPLPLFISEKYLFDILAARPVRIIADKKKQKELIDRLNQSVIEVTKTENQYGVALVGEPLTNFEKGDLPGWLIDVVAETGTVMGPGGLQEILAADRAKPLPAINAVIVNSKLGYDEQSRIMFKGLNEAQKLSGFYPDVPFLFYSDVSWEDLGDMVEYIGDNLTCRGNQFVERKDGNPLKEAVRNLRDYLDARHSPDTAVKKKYSTELEIADWLDPSGDLTSTLAEAMRDDFSFDDNLQRTEDKFGVLRKRAEMIFNDAKHKRGLLPPLDYLGQMQQLLFDGEYYDNNTKRMYVLRKKDLMPPTLSCAFSYFVMIANGGTHDANGKSLDVSGYVKGAKSPNIYKSCIFILLDLLRWYESLVGESTGPQFDETLPYADDDLVMLEGKDYYFIGNVHLKPKPFLCEGIPGRAIRVDRICVEKKPRPNGPRYYAADYQIDKKLI